MSWKSGQISFVSLVNSSHKEAPDGNSSPRFRYPRSFTYVSDSVISFGRMHVLEGRECPEETDISSCNSALSFRRSLSSSFIAGNIPANFPECSADMFPFSAVATSFTVPMVLHWRILINPSISLCFQAPRTDQAGCAGFCVLCILLSDIMQVQLSAGLARLWHICFS